MQEEETKRRTRRRGDELEKGGVGGEGGERGVGGGGGIPYLDQRFVLHPHTIKQTFPYFQQIRLAESRCNK